MREGKLTWRAFAAYWAAKLFVMAIILWLVSCGKEEKVVYAKAPAAHPQDTQPTCGPYPADYCTTYPGPR